MKISNWFDKLDFETNYFWKWLYYQILKLLSWDFKVFVRKSDIFIRWVLQKNGFDNFCIFKMHASFSIMFIPLRFVMSSIVQNPLLTSDQFSVKRSLANQWFLVVTNMRVKKKTVSFSSLEWELEKREKFLLSMSLTKAQGSRSLYKKFVEFLPVANTETNARLCKCSHS